MARYIDIDDFRKNAYYADTDLDIGVYLAEHGCADVVPKSEVAKIITTIKENFEIGYGGVCEFNKLLDDIEKKYAKESGGK